uniref:Uncharacterized protein n=1 Tax=Octopus bimaculoides TaxID=37653 RepID=A0A0L8HD14_OCTBM
MTLANKTEDYILIPQRGVDSLIAKKFLKHYFIALFTYNFQTIEYPCFAFIDKLQQFD